MTDKNKPRPKRQSARLKHLQPEFGELNETELKLRLYELNQPTTTEPFYTILTPEIKTGPQHSTFRESLKNKSS